MQIQNDSLRTYELPQKECAAPILKIKPNSARILAEQYILMLLLGILFSSGIYINLLFLKFQNSKSILLYSIIFILSLIIINLTIVHARVFANQYAFFPDRITYGKDVIMLKNINMVLQHNGMFDKLFHTTTISLDEYKMNGMPESEKLVEYIKNLIAYAKVH